MLLELTADEARQLIGCSKILLEEDLIPARFPVAPNSPYRHGYDWLYLAERKLNGHLKPWLADHRLGLIGEHGLLSEGLSNAFCHGHGRDPHMPIRIVIRVGDKGVLVEIRDKGAGFMVKQTLQRFHAGKAYYSVAGNGILHMAESSDFGAFFNADGNIFYMIHLFDNGLENLQTVGEPEQSMVPALEGDGLPVLPALASRPTDLKPWIRGAVLRTARKSLHRIDIGEELAKALLQMGDHLLRLSEELTLRHLAAGRPEMIHIQTPQAGMLFYREAGADIAAWLHQDTNPTMACKLFRDYFGLLNQIPVV